MAIYHTFGDEEGNLVRDAPTYARYPGHDIMKYAGELVLKRNPAMASIYPIKVTTQVVGNALAVR